MRRSSRLVVLVLASLLAATGEAIAQRYDPTLSFETIETPHFRIHFHQDSRALAERLATIVEDVRARATSVFRQVPAGPTHVILSGQDDVPNGWATPFPLNVIEIRASWPRPSSILGHTDDWLRLVFAHEFTHILHLDRSRGVMNVARRVFGRAPFVMPNLFLPTWQVEGIATWQESAMTGAGRVTDGMGRRFPAAAVTERRFPGLDRVSGGLVSWPGGDGPYIYGGLLHQQLANKFGAEAIDRWADATAAWPPYLGFLAFGRSFGGRLGAEWRDLESSASPAARTPSGDARRVTTDGFVPGSPRWDPSRPASLFYSRRTPGGFPAVMRVDTNDFRQERLAWRFYGEGIGSDGRRIVFDQLDLTRSTALHADLYEMDLTSGETRRLTTGARASDPDLSADGRRLVFVEETPDRRRIVIAPGASPADAPARVVSEAGVYFSAPRWSPNGLEIVAERARAGALPDVVLVDVATGHVEPLARGVGDRQATPTWTPDGETIVMAVADGRDPFRLVAVARQTRRAWDIPSPAFGARAPDVSPDGLRIAFLGFSADGEDVFVAPFDRSRWIERAARVDGPPAAAAPARPAAMSEPARYSPFGALLPRYWSPLLRFDDEVLEIGGETSGVDPLGRHEWRAAAWRRSDTARADWSASYVYSRWRPTVFVSASGEHRVFGAISESTRALSLGLAVPFSRVRRSQQVFAAVQAERLSAASTSGASAFVDRHALRAGWAWSSARMFGFSISPEEGAQLAVTSEHVLPALGATARADAVVVEGRAYRRAGFEHAVIAVRAAGAAATGDRFVRRRFGAACRNTASGLGDLGSDAVALVRGVSSACSLATRAGVINADYRVPLWRLERGVGVLPGFLRWIHGGVFVDAGDEWDVGDSPRWKLSTGVEFSADLVVGYTLPLTIAAGVAWTHDQAGSFTSGPRGYVRVGRAF